MNEENVIQNGVTEASPALPIDINEEGERNPTGKIARLPYKVREQLNRRLRNNAPESETLPWLNGLPSTKKILLTQFDGKPVNSQNLSNWRRGRHKQWLNRQVSNDEILGLTEDAKDFSRTAGSSLAHGTASIAAAKILKVIQGLPADQSSVNDLTKISYAVSALLNVEQNEVRLEHEKTRVYQRNEQLVLSWDKHLRDCVAIALRVLNDAQAKAIQEADIDNGEKIELMGHHLFGDKWQGREVREAKSDSGS
jgi:hypothetical protein